MQAEPRRLSAAYLLFAAILCFSISVPALADPPNFLFGRWTLTLPSNNCPVVAIEFQPNTETFFARAMAGFEAETIKQPASYDFSDPEKIYISSLGRRSEWRKLSDNKIQNSSSCIFQKAERQSILSLAISAGAHAARRCNGATRRRLEPRERREHLGSGRRYDPKMAWLVCRGKL